MKPLISLHQTPNGYYFFDANKDEVVSINKESYDYLSVLCSDDVNVPVMPEELHELKEQGYLKVESAVEKVQHAYTEHLDTFLRRKISKITLQLTQDCNLRCKYCIYSEEHSEMQRTHSNKKMSWETAKKALDFLKEHSIDSTKINIGFYGGEPLLEFDLMKQIITYCNKSFVGKKLTYNITSNGTILTDEIIMFLKEHDISLMISLDGPKEINDINRVFADGSGTFDTIAKKVNRIKEIAPDYSDKLQISMVMDPQNDYDCINEIHLEGSDFRKLNISASLIDNEYGGERLQFSSQYIWKMEYQNFLALLSYYRRYLKDSVLPISNSWIAQVLDENSKTANGAALQQTDVPSGPCIPGQLRLFVNVDGSFFPCERVSEKSSAMYIGSLKDGFNLKNAQDILNIGKLTENECKKCWCFRYCGMCVKKADSTSGELSAEVKLSFCDGTRNDVYRKMQTRILFKEIPKYYSLNLRGE